MLSLYDKNGLIFWNQDEIRIRRVLQDSFTNDIKASLLEMNPAWTFHEVEAPLLTPRSLVNEGYSNADIWVQEGQEVVLRPETTPGSYVYAKHLLSGQARPTKPPFVVWQAGKSFRREQEQVSKNMRLKEFYQQEFQCFFASDTLNDYHKEILEPISEMIWCHVGLPTRIVESDRLPSYSRKTMDVEVDNGDKWMEVCSISLREDFTEKAKFQAKKKVIEKDLLVLEVAIGLDRCVYNYFQRRAQKQKQT